jgi:hypothetical protein
MGCNCGRNRNKSKSKEQVQELLLANLPGKQLKATKKGKGFEWHEATLVKLNKN